MTKIEWADETWNPVVGCKVKSPGCTHCYAMRMAARLERMGNAPHYAGLTETVNGKAVWTGRVALAPEHILTAPLDWKTPRRIFPDSMGDIFYEAVPDAVIDRIFAVMALTPQHTYMPLTKRSDRMRAYMTNNAVRDSALAAHTPWPLPNVWLGVSAEDQRRADERIPDLLATPAAVRFVSAEPLLGALDISYWTTPNRLLNRPALDLIIVGGESGPGARPMHPDWARSIRDQCAAAGTAFFFKQWGEWAPFDALTKERREGRSPDHLSLDPETIVWRVGKKAARRMLDGRAWDEFPEAAA
jgi:protein gp37